MGCLYKFFCCAVFANGADFVSLSRHCKLTCIAYCLLSVFFVMGRGSGDKGRKAFAHIKSKQHRARRLRTLQDVGSGELGAEYLVKHLPDTDQIVLTPVDAGGGGGAALLTAPAKWEKTIATVWHIRLLHLSRTEAEFFTPHLVEGVPWEEVWVTMQQLAQPASEGFVANRGDNTKLYDRRGCNTYTVADRLNRPTSNNRAIQGCIGCH